MKRTLIVLFASVAVLALASPAHASGSTVVRGLQSAPVAECMGASSDFGTFEMAGDLNGCWYIDAFEADHFSPSGSAVFHGTEHFTGCIDQDGNGSCSATDPWGTFHTTFKFTAKFDAAGNELKGRCHHPIVGGSGAFADVHGVINFHDNVGSVVTADYRGPIRL